MPILILGSSKERAGIVASLYSIHHQRMSLSTRQSSISAVKLTGSLSYRIQSRVNTTTSDDKIRLAFRLYGPNMRTLARALLGPTHERKIKEKITHAVNALSPSTLRKVFSFRTGSLEDVPHAIATIICLERPQPEEEEYLADDLPKVTFTGPIVWEALRSAHKEMVYEKLTELLAIFAAIPQSRGFGGLLWEHFVHAQLTNGVDFTISRIYSQEPMKETRQTVLTDKRKRRQLS